MPVSSNPALQCIYHSFKFGVIQESDEDAFHAIFQVVNGNISWCLPQYQPLKTGLVTTCQLNLEPLTIVFWVWWCNQFHAFIWTISCQLADKGTTGACVKSPVKARENETCCSFLSHRACYFIVEVDPCCLGQSVLFVLNHFLVLHMSGSAFCEDLTPMVPEPVSCLFEVLSKVLLLFP